MTDKELIKQDKEPKCIYNRTLEERKKFCKYCSAACGVRIEEEPASKDLEEEVSNWRHNHFHGRRDKDASGEYLERESQLDLARHFAEWQKQESMQYLMEKAEEFLYLQLNNGSIECGNIEKLIDNFKKHMQNEM